MLDGRVYFRAPRSEVLVLLDTLAVQRFLPEGQWRIEDLLDRSRSKRYLGYKSSMLAARKGFVIVDLNQNPCFW